MTYDLKKLSGIRSKGKISELYMNGEIKTPVMIKYSQAIEAFKHERKATLDEWYKLPKKTSMYSVDRTMCKNHYLGL